eukprot:2929389-Ditylum_brightwellii.AAC.1
MGHLQPLIPIMMDNTTANGIVNGMVYWRPQDENLDIVKALQSCKGVLVLMSPRPIGPITADAFHATVTP